MKATHARRGRGKKCGNQAEMSLLAKERGLYIQELLNLVFQFNVHLQPILTIHHDHNRCIIISLDLCSYAFIYLNHHSSNPFASRPSETKASVQHH